MCEEKFIRLIKNFEDLKKEHEILKNSKEIDTQRDITVVTFLYRIRYQNYTLSKLNVYYIFTDRPSTGDCSINRRVFSSTYSNKDIIMPANARIFSIQIQL
jgi:hypothetical protein